MRTGRGCFSRRRRPRIWKRSTSRYADLVSPSCPPGELQIRVSKLLLQLGLAASGAEASRKLAEKAVKIDGEVVTNSAIPLETLPARLVVRLGKRAKVAVIGAVGGRLIPGSRCHGFRGYSSFANNLEAVMKFASGQALFMEHLFVEP